MRPPTPSATELAELSLGERMAYAIAAQDAEALRPLFATPLVFRAVTPRRFWDAETAVEVADDIVLGAWFHAGVVVEQLSILEVDTVGDVAKVSFRMTLALESGPAVVEQVAYYTLREGLIADIRLVCSGFRPTR